jgi:hypothetical protein
MFETDSYASRIYAFENDVLYAFSSPAYYGKGWGFYFIVNYKPKQRNQKPRAWLPECWLKCGQSLPILEIEDTITPQVTPFKTSITIQCLFAF